MASRISFSVQPSTPVHPTTPARNRRLSNFHKPVPSPPDSKHTSGAQRTPLRPFNRQTPAKPPRRQSFAPKSFHATPRLSPAKHNDQRQRQPQLSKAEISQMYSSTIKLCQDNKINARNTWTLNLIDYMSMLVKGDQDSDNVSRNVPFQDDLDVQSTQPLSASNTNFQLAGVTLDAGVKIYCSRVDSVHTNAFKVLGGLSRSGNEHSATSEDDLELDDQAADTGKRRIRSAKRTGRSTLENNLANITSQKLETDLAVDPLFHKMSAAFDEGGAKGMLMNNLPVGAQGQILFDSNELAEDLSILSNQLTEGCNSTDSPAYDISELLPTEGLDDAGGICSTFLRFYFARRRLLNINESTTDATSLTSSAFSTKNSAVPSDPQDDSFDDSPGLGFDYDDADLQNAGELGVFSAQDATQGRDMSTSRDDDEVQLYSADDHFPRFSQCSNLSIATAAQRGSLDLVEAGLALSGNSSYAFFDASSLSGWAGPQHWRFRATTAASVVTSTGRSRGEARKTKRPRGKTAMLLDFFSTAPTVDFAREFEPGKTGSSNQLSTAVRDGFAEKKVTLPDDLHYTTRSLAGLFLKPGAIVNERNMRKDPDSEHLAGDIGDEWYAFENDYDNTDIPSGGDAGSHDDCGDLITSNTFNDDMGMELIEEPTRVDKIDINYARVAKKVDVRQLKSGLWLKLCGEQNEICGETRPSTEVQGPDEVGSEQGSDGADIREGASQSLQEVVSDMSSFVPPDSLSDVSLPYVFICLLHLANEKTLSISQSGNDSLVDLIITSAQ